jgi:Ca-activated chloride channel family protein
MLESLQPKDRLAIVVFHSKTEVLLPSTTIEDAGTDEVKKKIRAMAARGTTDMTGGLSAAIEEVSRHMQGDGINRVLLLGDGVPNESAQLMPVVQSAADRGISITALGLGPDYDELLMGKIAQTTGGRFHYVSDSSKVAAFFQEEIVRLQRVYAKNAILELTAGPGVSIDAVVGQEISRVGNVVRVNVGDVSLGDKRDFIVRLSTGSRPHDGAPIELMDAALKFAAASGGGALERNVFLGAHASSDDAKIAAAKDPKVLDAAAKAQAAADTLEQIRRARDSDRPRSQAEPRSPGAARPSPAPAMAPEKRMQMHDDAMQVLQGMR